jgi:hypothetical protein
MNYRALLLGLLLITLTSCGGSLAPAPSLKDVELIPLENSDLSTVSVELNGQQIQLSCSEVPVTGCFLRIPETADLAPMVQEWQGDARILRLAVGTPAGLEVGLVPLPGYEHGPVTASLELGSAPHNTSIPPYTAANQLLADVFDVTSLSDTEVALKWMQVNVGDYDFNGEVSVSDLIPIAMRFSHQIDYSVADPTTLPDFWVDGDHNGEIGIADIVPIAQHYGSEVDGYKITQNGELLALGSPDEPNVVRDRQPQPSLPPLYSVIVSGHEYDSWNVIPVDHDGQSGTSLEDVVKEVAVLKAQVTISGVPQYKLDGTGAIGDGSGYSVLRIVDPGEIVDGAEIGRGIDDSLGARFFYNIPRNQVLYLQVLYYPTVDPATGVFRSPSPESKGQPVPQEAMTITSIPFVLASNTSMLRIKVGIQFTPNPAGGYFIHSMPVFDPPLPTLAPDRPLTLPLWPALTSQFDYQANTVSMDVHGNGDYATAPELTDLDQDGISGSRYEQIRDYFQFQKPAPILGSLTGRVISFNEHEGLLKLKAPMVAIQSGTFTLPDTWVRFSETAIFEEHLTLDDGVLDRAIDPSSLVAGEWGNNIVAEVDFLGGSQPGEWRTIWLRRLIRVVPNEAHVWLP